ncbi:hypothetical protein CR513_07685, partial [Mucuna pruriens]
MERDAMTYTKHYNKYQWHVDTMLLCPQRDLEETSYVNKLLASIAKIQGVIRWPTKVGHVKVVEGTTQMGYLTSLRTPFVTLTANPLLLTHESSLITTFPFGRKENPFCTHF